MARAFVLEFEQFAMQLPVFLVSRAGDPHDAPHLGLAAVIAEQHGQQLGNVEAIALGATLLTLDLDGGRIHDDVADADAQQPAVQPETVPAGLVAGTHGRVVGQAEAALGLGDLAEQAVPVACGDGAQGGAWPWPTVKASFHSVQPSSKARYRQGVVVGIESWLRVAVMTSLLFAGENSGDFLDR